MELRTDRLLLRRWRASDVEPMGAINADPEVARYLNRPPPDGAFVSGPGDALAPGRLRAVGARVDRARGHRASCSASPDSGTHRSFRQLEFEVEIGWRLARSAWGRGLATEAGEAALAHARDALGLRRLISVIHPENVRSQRVAEKLGMAVGRRVHNPVLGIPVEVWELEL